MQHARSSILEISGRNAASTSAILLSANPQASFLIQASYWSMQEICNGVKLIQIPPLDQD